jgi:small subunit ribosomal protein S8
MVKDTISELIISLKHANHLKKESVFIPYSNFKKAVLEKLQKLSYVNDVSEIFVQDRKRGSKKDKERENTEKIKNKRLEVKLAYTEDNQPKIREIKRVSKLSCRLYSNAKDLKPVKFGHGFCILSTPKGILTNIEAKRDNVGGEKLFTIF